MGSKLVLTARARRKFTEKGKDTQAERRVKEQKKKNEGVSVGGEQ